MSRYQKPRTAKPGVRRRKVRACGLNRGARYGLTEEQMIGAKKRIQNNFKRGVLETDDMVNLKRQSESRSRVAVLIDGKWFVVIYNRKHQAIQAIRAFTPRSLVDSQSVPSQEVLAGRQKAAWLAGEIAAPI